MKVITFLTFFIFGINYVFSQEVIATSGQTSTNSSNQVSWTIGEIAIETVESASNTLTQGFHQTRIIVTALNELTTQDIEIKVYPNPTRDFVNIHFSKKIDIPSYSLFDLSGKLIEQRNIISNEAKINMTEFAEGSYILKLISNKQQLLQTFKIIKR
ncbi:MAG: T9SS type A sorting domain-containing protein [Prolixibacteraceae bacterium]|jgi:hypothetical protein|nr:T9SS type A sorting domain-containing protein [Prolixibacteraceae bacterium]MBT6005104.1 T9SS type A sorting domain-containing protein [Prolixibacteraceae bacterium]MBT6764053.1 T9SS type A sorting domain-containing protein [Prolixibacteraceae bacterium]MBT6998071.1 T9SS type A sorting domain-containing protein [Prolixibacteraceae bacterium]MBT7395214.1 T9SS type A sorting domain-containing protein [Prolixibacteraceae bacterium]